MKVQGSTHTASATLLVYRLSQLLLSRLLLQDVHKPASKQGGLSSKGQLSAAGGLSLARRDVSVSTAEEVLVNSWRSARGAQCALTRPMKVLISCHRFFGRWARARHSSWKYLPNIIPTLHPLVQSQIRALRWAAPSQAEVTDLNCSDHSTTSYLPAWFASFMEISIFQSPRKLASFFTEGTESSPEIRIAWGF